MRHTTSPGECPRCASSKDVREKVLLINKLNAGHLKHHPNERSSCACEGSLSVDGLKPEFVAEGPLQQFVVGLYCEACGTGFVPEGMAAGGSEMTVVREEKGAARSVYRPRWSTQRSRLFDLFSSISRRLVTTLSA